MHAADFIDLNRPFFCIKPNYVLSSPYSGGDVMKIRCLFQHAYFCCWRSILSVDLDPMTPEFCLSLRNSLPAAVLPVHSNMSFYRSAAAAAAHHQNFECTSCSQNAASNHKSSFDSSRSAGSAHPH